MPIEVRSIYAHDFFTFMQINMELTFSSFAKIFIKYFNEVLTLPSEGLTFKYSNKVLKNIITSFDFNKYNPSETYKF